MSHGTKTVVIYAAPEVRAVCPPDFIEGRWMQVPAETETIAIATPPGARPLIVRPTGRMERNEVGMTAPVWEVRWDDFAVDDD